MYLLKARREGLEPSAIAETYAGAIRTSLAAADIAIDGFIEPKPNGLYADFVAEVVQRLLEADLIEARHAPVLLDDRGRVLHEAFVRGICPHCGSGADGNACEACGRPIGCAALLDPVDAITGRPAGRGHALRLHLLLSKLAPRLDVIIKELRFPARVYACAQGILDAGIPDIPISQPTPWGLEVRVAGFEDHVLYAWFEMAAGYLYGAARASDPKASDTAGLWTAARRAFSREREVVHCYGFDNAWYHALLFPAIYTALDLTPPRVHVVNELLDLDGSKFSTSRNHLILGQELLSEVPTDAVRFGLCLARPQETRADFRLRSFLRTANALFCEAIPTWILRLDALVAPHGRCAPEPGAWLPDHEAYLARIRALAEAAEAALAPDRFNPRSLAEILASFVDDSRRFCVAQGALSVDGAQADYARTAAALGLMGLAAFGILAEPIMPGLASGMRAAVGAPSKPSAVLQFLPKGQAFDASRVMLPKMIDAPRTAARLVARAVV